MLRGSEGAPDKHGKACWLTIWKLSFEDKRITEITVADSGDRVCGECDRMSL